MKSIFRVFRRTAPAVRTSLRCPAPPLGRGELLEGFPLRPDEPPRPARSDSDQPLAPNTGRTLRIDCYRFMSFQGTLSRFQSSGLRRLGASRPASPRGWAGISLAGQGFRRVAGPRLGNSTGAAPEPAGSQGRRRDLRSRRFDAPGQQSSLGVRESIGPDCPRAVLKPGSKTARVQPCSATRRSNRQFTEPDAFPLALRQ